MSTVNLNVKGMGEERMEDGGERGTFTLVISWKNLNVFKSFYGRVKCRGLRKEGCLMRKKRT